MQVIIDVPDTLPPEFLKLRIQEIEQNLKNEAEFFQCIVYLIKKHYRRIKKVSSGLIMTKHLFTV